MATELTVNSPIQPTVSARTTDATGNPRQDSTLRLDQIELGKSLQGHVVGMLEDGTAIVKISANPQQSGNVQMKLPAGYQVGDALQLSLLSQGGNRPSFVLQTTTPFSDSVNLSSTAQFLEKTLLEHPQPTRIQGTQPLTEQGAPASGPLAQELNHTVENSGVFYEAHLKQWHDGQRTLEQIQQEPQNQQAQATQETASQLLPAQLDSLENKRFAWEGEVWPNQTMQWDICEDQPQQSSQSAEADGGEKTWKTSLRLQLPHLGGVSANISLQGNHVSLQFATQDAESASALKIASKQLLDALQGGGSHIENFSVQHDVSI